MATIIAGSPAQFTVTVQADGTPIAVTGPVTARVFSMDGRQELVASQDLADDATGANWPAGVVAVTLDAGATAALEPGAAMLVLAGSFGIKRFQLTVETLFAPTRTSLFIKDIVIEELRNDRLMAAAAGVLQDVKVSDDYLWQKIRAAESELAHTLRVPFVPTRFFPQQPTAEQITALNGMAWEVESAPDYEAQMFAGDRWGYIITRQKPIIDVQLMRFTYPTEANGYFDIPLQWLSLDKKYGHIRIVPTSNAMLTSMAGLVMMNIAGGRTIPSMVHLEYTAGLTDVEGNWPELLDCIKKMAVAKVVADAYLPQSGSISADGLSESVSVDMSKYHESVDHIINGTNGNGGLMARIHGIRTMVL